MKITRLFITKNTMPAFKRAPSAQKKAPNGQKETVYYSNTIKEAKDFLGIKNLALILHQSSFPVKDNDLFVGSHINKKAIELNKFLKMHGFDSIQLGPPGLTRLSPYNSGIYSKNYIYADMEKLGTKAYAEILPKNTLKNVLNSIDKTKEYEKISDKTNFNRAFYIYDKLFAIAYENLIEKASKKDKDAIKLYKEFNNYKIKEQKWLDNDALFYHFKNKFGMDENFFEWPDLIKKLIIYKNDVTSPNHKKATNYHNSVTKKHQKSLDLFKFKQFVLDKQERDFVTQNPDKLKYITDAIIGFSLADYWANQQAFIKDYRIGTPYGGEGRPIGNGSIWGQNQTWDIPVLDPQKLFIKNSKGEIIDLDIAGKLLKDKFSRLLDTYQNIRIDHVIGLIDPWIYNQNDIEIKYGRYENEPTETAEHIIYKNAHGVNISLAGKENAYDVNKKGWDKEVTKEINTYIQNMPVLDPDGDYAKILDEILLPLFQEKGLKTNDIVWESLGCNTEKFDEVYKNPKRPLPDISSSYQYQLQHRPQNDWMMIGCHDHSPFSQICTDNFYKEKKNEGNIMYPNYLIGSLYPDKTNEEKNKLIENMDWDRRFRVKTKYEELLRFGKQIQFTFMDFFGLDKTYNYAGTQNTENWKLRLKKTYKEDYYKALEWKPGENGVYNIPLNMPESLGRAVRSKIIMDGKNLQDFKELLDKLEYCDKFILKQPEK